MKRLITSTLVLGFALVLALGSYVNGTVSAQGGTGNGQVPTTGGQTTTANQLVVRSQDVSNGAVLVDSFNAPATGWLLIQRSSNGTPGAVIGFAPVVAGQNQAIRINVKTERTNARRNAEDTDNSNVAPFVTSTLFASFAPDAGAASPIGSPPSGIENRTTLRVAFGSAAPSPNGALAGQSVTTGGNATSRINVAAQSVPNLAAARYDNASNFVVISSLTATQDGWLFIRKDANGQPGAVIGYAPVLAGLNTGVRVAIQVGRARGNNGDTHGNFDNVTPTLWATLTADPSASTPFATPKAAVQDQGFYAAVPFSSTGQATSGAQAGAAPTTGGQSNQSTTTGAQTGALGRNQIVARAQDVVGNRIVVDSVNAAETGWLLIHTDANGQPGGVIGYAPVFAGLNRNVTVNVTLSHTGRNDRDNITSVLWATLNPDPAAATPFASPSAAVQTSGVTRAAFSSTAAGGVSAGAK